jgi:hypothetical protein
MLPYTTYKIPESTKNKTAPSGKWLWMVVGGEISGPELDLLQKISAALQADFKADVLQIVFDKNQLISISDISPVDTKLIISFGIAPADLGLWIDLPRPGIRMLEHFSFILTLPLEKLADHLKAKKELWNCMQNFMDES